MNEPQHIKEESYPPVRIYILVGVILTIVTAIEVAVFYLDVPNSLLVGIFIILSLLKFVLVIMFFMHLRYDHKLFSVFFTGGTVLAIAIGLAFIGLFQNFDVGDPNPKVMPVQHQAPVVIEPPQVLTQTLTPPTTLVAEGPVDIDGTQVFIAKGCGACHSVEGLPGAVGVVGPTLTHIATIAGQRVINLDSEEYIRQSIIDPGVVLVEGYGALMPPTIRDSMSDEEFEVLVEYLLSLQ